MPGGVIPWMSRYPMASPDDRHSSPDDTAEERWVSSILAAARARDRSPDRLRSSVEALTSARPARRRSSILGLAGSMPGLARARFPIAGGAAALVAVVVALVVALAAPGPGGPTVAAAAALANRGPASVAPSLDPADRTRLALSVGNLSFPSWSTGYASTATGARFDRLDGRAVATVYYEISGTRVAYSIVGAPALASPSRWARSWTAPYGFRTSRERGRTTVAWTEAGHTCIVSAVGVGPVFLERLVTGG